MSGVPCLRRQGTTLAIAGALILLNAAADAALINGSFESGIDPDSNLIERAILLTAPDTNSITGWTISSGTVDYIGSRWIAGDGGRCLDLSGESSGTILQRVDGFTTGQDYRLVFLMAASPEDFVGDPEEMRVSVGSVTQIFSVSDIGTFEDLGWQQYTINFSATAPTQTLTFERLGSSVFGPVLDGISIGAVPESGYVGLATLTLILLTFAWHKRRSRR